MREVDVVVVGGGVMGAAAAEALARRGREVTLFERFRIGHARGSSHGRARVFRLSYDTPDWVRMMQEALPLWRRLEDAAGETLLTTTGGLDVDPPPANAEALAACGVEHELVPATEAMDRYPGLALPRDARVLVQGEAGVVHAERAWRAFADRARAEGAEVLEDTRVTRVGPSGDRAEVQTEADTFRARAAVVTAGAWARTLLEGVADLPVQVTLETPAYFRHPRPTTLPILVEWRGEPPRYALPSDKWLKAAEHHGGDEADPEEEGEPNGRSAARVAAWVAERFPEADPAAAFLESCLYTNTDDEGFVMERHGPIVVGSPCSGHGFKFAPLTGERLADLVERG